MIKVYEVSRKYINAIHAQQQILTFNWFTYLLYIARKKHREIFELFQKYYTKYFMKYFTPKNFMKFYITTYKCLYLRALLTYFILTGVVCVGLPDLLDVHGSLARLLDEDACLSGLCQTDMSSGLCAAVHRGPFEDVGDKTGFRLTMIEDLHDDRLAMLWDEDHELERKRRATKIGYCVN